MNHILSSIRYRVSVLVEPETVHRVFLQRAVNEAFSNWSDAQFGAALDYGCGDCPYQKELDRVAKRVVTADIGNNPFANMAISPSGLLPVPDEAMDLVVSFQVLEHVADYRAYLLESARVCKKGGWLLISVPSVWPFHPHPTDYRRWMLPGLEYDLFQAGFEINRKWAVLNPVSTALQYFLSVCRYSLWNSIGWRWLVMLLALLLNPCILVSEKCFQGTYCLGAGNYVLIARRK